MLPISLQLCLAAVREAEAAVMATHAGRLEAEAAGEVAEERLWGRRTYHAGKSKHSPYGISPRIWMGGDVENHRRPQALRGACVRSPLSRPCFLCV